MATCKFYWQDGAKKFTQKIENGKILFFEYHNVVKDGAGSKGTYTLHGDSLHLTLPDHQEFYRMYRNKTDFDRISLSPVTSKYEIICDEGCADVYVRDN